ncbi:AMP-binding enzyme [Microdochium trichocladiopsis]|uniref:AMP-binding enzyme n=1 Tax=Microdochium trichocladiopsis TaxID=1682393 RepID=A0A9P8Y690_9PEZI|nr:AMP-binding enzyme [Microdochium trichocladiopsis]KAH7029835.1 AMP-binding enzyme [Microdochium trichocladiopsis]
MRTYMSDKIDIPRDQNLTELLHTTASDIPDSHLIAKDSLTNRSITLGELRDRAGRIANGLKSKLSPPDQARWALSLPNSVEFLEAVHAILWTGGVVCPINHALKPTEIGHGLAVSRPQYIIAYGPTLPAILEAIRVAAAELSAQGVTWHKPQVLTMITRPDSPEDKLLHLPDDFFAAERLPIPHWPDTTIRLATIHLSSGTTGKPKGVELTHFNFVANVHQLVAHDTLCNDSGRPHRHPLKKHFHPGSRTVAFTPWVHIGNTTMPLFLGPYTGMFHHAMPSYSLAEFARLVGSDRATCFQGVPSVVLRLANDADELTRKHDFSQAQVINVGGAPLSDELVGKLYSRAPWRLNNVYGMTEAAGYVAYQKFGEVLPAGVVGKLLPGIEARLMVEGKGEDAPLGGPGELWLHGPNITRGYAFNDEANEKNFPERGWYNTGDVCTIDSQGRVSVVGRTKELIKYKGFQVSPNELEVYVNGHPDVVEGGVGATWDESQLTELPTAWVVLHGRCKALSEDKRRRVLRSIQEGVNTKVSGYKKLRGGVWEIKALPKNPTGKILRKAMGEMRNGLCSLDSPIQAKL